MNLLIISLLLFVSCADDESISTPSANTTVALDTWEQRKDAIVNIISINCSSCHSISGGTSPNLNIELANEWDALQTTYFTAGDFENSLLYQVVSGSNPSMPPSGNFLSASELTIFETFIDEYDED